MLLFLYIGCEATLSLPDSAGIFLEDANIFLLQVRYKPVSQSCQRKMHLSLGDLSIDMLGNNIIQPISIWCRLYCF